MPGNTSWVACDEFLDDFVERLAGEPLLPQAEVEGVVEQRLVVGTDVEHHRQAAARVQSGAGRIKGELADRDAHAVGAQVAEAEDALAVGDDDHRRFAMRPVAHDLRDAAPVGGRHEQTARPAVDVAELLAGEADRRRVDDRHHLVRVLHDQPVEERLVAVLQCLDQDVLRERRLQAMEVLQHTRDLVFLRADVRRQQSAQSERVALRAGERRALVQRRVAQQRDAAREPLGQGRGKGTLVTFLLHD